MTILYPLPPVQIFPILSLRGIKCSQHGLTWCVSGDGGGGREGANDTVPLVTIHVEAWIVEPTHVPPTAKLSNTFYFTFLLPDKLNQNVRNVLPSNIDEARSIIRKIELDKQQRLEDSGK